MNSTGYQAAGFEGEADRIIEEMQGGPICDVSPARSRNILANALRAAALAEREGCAAALEDAHIGHTEAICLAAAIIRARR